MWYQTIFNFFLILIITVQFFFKEFFFVFNPFCDNKRIVLINFDFEPNDEEINTAAEKLMNAEI